MGLVVDTSALVALERAPGHWVSHLETVGDEPCALPAIVLAELLVGVRMAKGARRRRQRQAKIDALVARVPLIDFDEELVPLIFDFFKKSLVIWGHRGLERCAVRTASPSRGSRRLFSST